MANEKRLYKGNVVYSVKGIANISGVKESAILCRAETLMLKYPKNVYRISNEGQAYFFDEVFIINFKPGNPIPLGAGRKGSFFYKKIKKNLLFFTLS